MEAASIRRSAISVCALALALTLPGASACSKPEPNAQGKELFRACTSCHGTSGMGDRSVSAPTIAGLPAWYVEAQVTKFKTGVRGNHPDDIEGMRMRPMAKQMMNESEIKAVAAYVASMPPSTNLRTLQGGDAKAGETRWGPCTACHGLNGKGNEQLKAPPLANQADWYLLSQLKKFKTGVRGADAKDASGLTMRPMALTLPDDQAMLDVLAFVSRL